MSAEAAGHCYCGIPDITSTYYFSCEKCKRKFHEECLKSGPASALKGDYLYRFKCEMCGGGEEELTRMRLQWVQVVHLTLYNLQLAGSGMCGYFRWKEHICTFIDNHWTTFFGSQRKKTSLWHGTVAGVLSQGCPAIFVSGANELKESGWWRLKELQPPNPHKQSTPVTKPAVKKKEISPTPKDAPKEGLRSRRGKTSIEAAMELKAKRSTLTEAKEIRKTKLAKSQADESQILNQSAENLQCQTESQVNQSIDCLQSSAQSTENTQSSGHSSEHVQYVAQKDGSTPLNPREKTLARPEKLLAFTGLFSKSDSGTLLMDGTTSGPVTSSWSMVSSRSGSLADCSDEGSNISQSSYLTEKDLQFQATVPNLLLSDDAAAHDADESDLEIDPGTITPPGSPFRMEESPTVQEMLSAIDESSYLDNSNLDNSCQGSTSMDTSNPDSLYSSSNQANFSFFRNIDSNTSQGEIDTARSVVDSESDSVSSSSSEVEDSQLDGDTGEKHERRRKRKLETEEQPTAVVLPKCQYQLMSTFEERQLLKKLEAASETCRLPPHLNRLKRKLKVRQLKREHGVPQFDLDAEMNKLSQRCFGLNMERLINNPGNCYHGDMRILDKFQTNVSNFSRAQLHQQPSFLNRLVGYEDDQLHTVCSPYTARILKPFIWRDYESRPLKMRLLAEIKAYPHRNDPTWKPEPLPPIDYCYVRPQHIASVNALCRECFWPGIDVSECLQYPDFSCVALYRKIVIGFAFMVPDVKQNEAYISFIFTHPEWRRAHMATFMLYHLIQTCMGKDVTLHCSATNNAMLLYQKFGFKPEEYILDFYDKYFPADTTQCKHAFLLRLRR
ncbi:cysteine-rich protein 2-binding protein-like isoform X2 [Mercenaria mercenaria]|uniref:cysteine-rich protein 2-binding protein-like isoform X2 n=1 Tax=Mercenaria mercenaria TaxID=6596 RepID=UPI00234ED8B2|nr:cysteine-rich protein 2-binding protein-like isoform X2 [Mercenaria mercenaria]